MRFSPKTEQEVAAAGLWAKGTYHFEIAEASDTVSKNNNDMTALVVRIYDKEGKSRKVFDWLVDTEGGAYKIRHFAEATGLLAQYETGNMPAEIMVGKTGRCEVIVQKDKTGAYPDKNAISDYLKAEPGAAPVSFDRKDLDDEIPF